MMRLIADLVMTTSLSAAYSPTAAPPRMPGPPSPSPAPPAARGIRATGSAGRGPRRRRRRRAWRRDRRVSRKRLHGAVDDPLEVGRRPAVHREVQEELAVTLRAAQRRGRHAEHMPAAEHRVTREALHDRAVLRGIAHHPALA